VAKGQTGCACSCHAMRRYSKIPNKYGRSNFAEDLSNPVSFFTVGQSWNTWSIYIIFTVLHASKIHRPPSDTSAFLHPSLQLAILRTRRSVIQLASEAPIQRGNLLKEEFCNEKSHEIEKLLKNDPSHEGKRHGPRFGTPWKSATIEICSGIRSCWRRITRVVIYMNVGIEIPATMRIEFPLSAKLRNKVGLFIAQD